MGRLGPTIVFNYIDLRRKFFIICFQIENIRTYVMLEKTIKVTKIFRSKLKLKAMNLFCFCRFINDYNKPIILILAQKKEDLGSNSHITGINSHFSKK